MNSKENLSHHQPLPTGTNLPWRSTHTFLASNQQAQTAPLWIKFPTSSFRKERECGCERECLF